MPGDTDSEEEREDWWMWCRQSWTSVKFHMESDKTLIEVSMSADEDESVGKWKSNTFYMLRKELKIEVKVGGGHGYQLTSDGSQWSFVPNDKAVSNWTSGNILRDVCNRMQLTSWQVWVGSAVLF